MDGETYAGLPAVAIAGAVARREVSAAEVVEAALGRIARLEPSLCAFREVWADGARARAAEVDRGVAAGDRLPLAGVPIGVKTGAAGPAGRPAGPVRRLLAAGCVPVGATSVPGPGTPWRTWGLGAGGPTVNPWRRDRSPGGSSAGSAAAVAAGMVPMATGADGAGSVRIPAAWCGVLGLKTTNGLLPVADRSGLAAPGVLVRCAADLTAWLECVPGIPVRGTGESTGESAGKDTGEGAGAPVAAVWSPDLGFARSDPDVVRVTRAAVDGLAAAGVVRLEPPEGPEGGAVLLDPGPAWLALRAPDGDRAAAQRTRAENDARLDALLAGGRLLLTPATPNRPHGHDGPGDRYSTALTWAFNLSGHPAVSVPAGLTGDGCPAGLQIVAARGGEALLASVVRAAEGAGLLTRAPGGAG